MHSLYSVVGKLDKILFRQQFYSHPTEPAPEGHAPSLSSVIIENWSSIMAPPEDQFQQIPWPETAELYQPYESNQILLPESSACLAVRTFLHMNGLRFKVSQKINTLAARRLVSARRKR